MKKRSTRAITLCLTVILLCGVLSGCGTKVKKVALADYPATVVASYGDEKIYLSEVNYNAKYEQWYSEMYYAAYFGADMWKQEIATGKTMEAFTKENVMAGALQTRVLLEHAEEYKVTLTEEDTAKVTDTVAAVLENMPEKLLAETNANEELLTDIYTRNALANKVWAAVVADVDTVVDDEEARQTAISYVLFSDNDTETDGEAAAKELLAAVEGGKTLKEAAEEKGLTASSTGYGRNDEQTSVLGQTAVALSTGEANTCYAEGTGWYVVYCDNDFDEARTESKKQSIISDRKDELFNTVYAGWEKKEFVVDESIWGNVKMDKMIYEAPATTEAATTEPATSEAATTEAATNAQ